MQRMIMCCLAFSISLMWLTQASASPTKRFDQATKTCRTFDQDSFWWGSGAQTFRSTCKPCHTKDSKEGGGFLHVESKTSRAWDRVFFEKYPQCAKDGSWDSLSMEQLLKLNDYLNRFGAFTYDANVANDCG
ncbi:MAG: hypothetical protein PF495_07425 [Spirochaetales bacterium]|nr:hypothetical protein [Spirochaetales bacterium]